MDKKLKKQRNKLYLRIILILLAVWIIVSAGYCVIRLSIEKAGAQNRALSDFSHIKQMMALGKDDVDLMFYDYFEFSYDEEHIDPSSNSQILITDRSTNKVVADSKDSIAARFNIKAQLTSAPIIVLINYYQLCRSIGKPNLEEIKTYLNTTRDDGNYYELVCTKLQAGLMLNPLELKIVLVNGKDSRLTIDDNVAVYDLSRSTIPDEQIYTSGTVRRNTIPKSFILDGKFSKDYIGSLTPEQRKQTIDMIRTGTFEYVFYSSDYLNYNSESQDDFSNMWRIQYAQNVNIFQSCKNDLILGTAIIFAFFFLLALILCVMIWRTVKAQIIQEQKRMELTGALAHDIKTPLFVISGYAYSLKEGIDESERDVYLDKIIEQTDEVNSLVHRMLDFSKLDSYSLTLNKTDFDLCESARKIADNHGALPDHKSIVFTHSGDNTINADKELVRTALQNLIDNAIQYSLPDSEIHIDVSDKRFSVSNRSEPLTKAELKQIRQPYMRKDKSRSKKGNGLGLSIVQSIAEQHDARFDMEMKDDLLTCSIRF